MPVATIPKPRISVELNWRVRYQPILLVLVGAVFILISTSRNGAGISPDSVDYIATARNLVKGEGFTNYDGSPTVMWPPLYSTLLALISGISGIDPARFAHILNSVIFGLIVYVGGRLIYRHVSPRSSFALLGLLAILGSSVLYDVSVMAWTEPLFILFVLLSLLFVESYRAKKNTTSLILLSAAIALAALTRYLGVTLIAWAGLILLFTPQGSFKKKIAHLAVFIFISGLPLGVWLVRNYGLSGTIFGDRAASTFTLSQNIDLALNSIMDWYIPARFAGRNLLLVLIGLGAGFLTGMSLISHWQWWKEKLRRAGPLVLFVLLYVGFLLVLTTLSANDQIGSRLLSPIYVPLTILLLLYILALAERYTLRLSTKWVPAIASILIALWLIYPIQATIQNAVRQYPTGQGYASKAWLDSETVQYLLQHPALTSGCSFYTNDPRAAYFLAHLPAERSPASTRYNSTEVVNEISSLAGAWPEKDPACLVWFNPIDRPWLFTVPELQKIATFNPIANLSDGGIFTVRRK